MRAGSTASRFIAWSPTLGCLAALFVFLLAVVDPSLELHARKIPFYPGSDAFRAALKVPGGLLDYAANAALQICEHAWLGSVVAVGLAAWLALATRRLLALVTGQPPLLLHLLPLCLFAGLLADYRVPWPVCGTVSALALTVPAAAWTLSGSRPWVRWAAFAALATAGGYAGGWPVAAAATASSVLLEALAARKPASAVATLLAGCGLSWWLWNAVRVAGIAPSGRTEADWILRAGSALPAAGPLLLAAAALLRGRLSGLARHWGARLAGAGALITATSFLIHAVFNPVLRTYLQLDHWLENGQWERVLAAPEVRTLRAPLVTLAVGRALAETGQLTDNFFAFPQDMGQNLLPNYDAPHEVFRQYAALMLELGLVEEANHFASEALELEGELPMTLKLLARIFVLKGRPEAARVYLSRLRLSLHERAWCDRYLAGLDRDPTLADEPEIARVRRLQVREDRLSADAETLLTLAADANPLNRRAVEYLLLLHLTRGKMDAFARDLPRLQQIVPAGPLPRHVEEGILFAAATGQGSGLEGFQARVRPETARRFAEWVGLINSSAGDQALASFGDTLWFYLTFRRCPGSRDAVVHAQRRCAESRPAEPGWIGERRASDKGAGKAADSSGTRSDRPVLVPDYADVVFPPNMAAPTFTIRNLAREYRVTVRASQGDPIEIRQRSPAISIPLDRWRALLAVNRGRSLRMEIALLREDGARVVLSPVTMQVSNDDIDPYLTYRLMKPLHNFYRTMGIYQRDLTGYREAPVERNDRIAGGCLNCHTFLDHDTATMSLNVRHPDYSNPLILVHGGQAIRVAKTAGYMSWHPGGRLIAYSSNKLSLLFHTSGEPREVYDADSDLGIYSLDRNAVETPPAIAAPDWNENWPAWSPAGDALYFCRAPKLPVERYRDVKYELVQAPYDARTGVWGAPEVLVSAGDVAGSINQPRPSPDGRFLLFTVSDYGNFPIYRSEADLHILDLRTRKHWKAESNSEEADTWHCWSSNGRWVVFSSKRRDGQFARPHFSHVDEAGHFSKAFILPQKDPEFYDSYLNTFNVPELTREPVRVSESDLGAAVRSLTRVLYPKAAANAAQGRPPEPEPYLRSPGLE